MSLISPSKIVAFPRPLSLLWVGCLGCVLGVGLGSERVAMAQPIAAEAEEDSASSDRDWASPSLATALATAPFHLAQDPASTVSSDRPQADFALADFTPADLAPADLTPADFAPWEPEQELGADPVERAGSKVAAPEVAGSKVAGSEVAAPEFTGSGVAAPEGAGPEVAVSKLAVLKLAPVGPSRSQPEFAPFVLSQRSDRSDNLPRSTVPSGGELEAGGEREAEGAEAGSQPLETPEIGETGEMGDGPMQVGAAIDPELGILRLQEQETNLQPAKTLPSQQSYPRFSYGLRGQVGFVYSSNVLGSQNSVSDHITQEGLSFTVVPQISQRTAVIAQLGGSWSQYGEFYGLDYRQFSSQIRVRHSLTERTYGELGWQHQEYFEADGGDRFLKTNTLQASLVHQKPLTPRLDLNNFYQSQLSLSDPSSRNQVVQRLGSGLSYELRPDLDFGLNYNLEVSAFTESDRLDFYNQALASLDWEFAPRQRLRMFTGFAFGESSVESIKFDGFLFGLGLETGLRF